MDLIFEALKDGTRRRILELLSERSMTAGELSSFFDITKPSLSHHLKQLQTAGLVNAQKKGRFVIYSQNGAAFKEILKWLYETAGNVWMLSEEK